MFEKPTAQFAIGLEPEGKFLKGALLSVKGHKPKIERLFTTPLEYKENVSAHHTILHHVTPSLPRDALRKALFVTAMTSQETLIRNLDIKLTKEKDIDAVLAFQAEPLIPYPINQAVLEKVILSADENGSQITLFSIRKNDLQQHIDLFNSLNIEPESIGCYPQALANFSKEYTTTQELHFVLYLAPKESTTLLVDNGKVFAGHASTYGIEPMLTAIASINLDPATIDFNAVAADPQSPLYPSLETLRLELNRTIYALTKQSRGQDIPSILIVGDGATIGNLTEYLTLYLKKNNITPTPTEGNVTSTDLRRYALPIGLALGCLEGSLHRLNFRQAEYTYPHPWKRLKAPLAVYILCCLLITLFAFKLGSQITNSDTEKARAEYEHLLQILNTDHASFEKKAFATKAEDVRPIDKLSIDAINQRLDWIDKDIQNTPFVFPLNPNTPRVSDVLAWLTSNPKVAKVDPATGQRTALLQIESFNYSMVKRPDKNNPKQHYQVKVEVEFSSKEPMWARDLHDYLVSPNEFIDPKNEVKWSAGQGRYRATFFLKDKTYYP